LIAQAEERGLGRLEELTSELFVGDQATDEHLDNPMGHGDRLSGSPQGKVRTATDAVVNRRLGTCLLEISG
jgi:hypothetical protein